MVETRLLLAIVAVVASVLVVFNLGGALNLQLPSHEDAGLFDQPPSIGGGGGVKPVSPLLPSVLPAERPLPLPVLQEQQQGEEQRPPGKSIVLIHVGKTGGETVRHTLRITCEMRKNPVQRKICEDSFLVAKKESALSRSTIGTLHCDLLVPSDSLERATMLLWTLRNPLDRVVSWFHYVNPANCRPLVDYDSTACNTNRSIAAKTSAAVASKKKKGSQWAVKFFGCFSTINHFADALLEGNDKDALSSGPVAHSPKQDCSAIAWRTILGKASASSGHVYFNYQHYWKATMMAEDQHSNHTNTTNEIWVLRTEYLWDDMLHVEQLLSNSSNSSSTTTDDVHHLSERRNVTHGSEGHIQRDELSSRGRERLCCALRDEIAIYIDLLRRASNLKEDERDRSLDYLAQQCGEISSSEAGASRRNKDITTAANYYCQRS